MSFFYNSISFDYSFFAQIIQNVLFINPWIIIIY